MARVGQWPSIWWFALGYFAAYVPYSALTKALSSGYIVSIPRIENLALLPVSAIAALLGAMTFVTAMGWWKYAGRGRIGNLEFPCPSRYTLLSGLGSATVIVTTTLAYTFDGVSIVFMMLLLRGGVLVLAPIVDALSGRHVRWFSWLALALSLGSLVVTFVGNDDLRLTGVAMIDVGLYLAAYFVRLRFMSKLAKNADPNAARRYFVEEQCVATPTVLIALIVLALVGPSDVAVPLWRGFTDLPTPSAWVLVFLIGLMSQGTGIFGGLVLLDKRENSFSVPVNRCSSMLAGLGATLVIWWLWNGAAPVPREFLAASLVIAAIVVLSLPTLLLKKKNA
jgi:hypothetical protein